MNSFHLVRNPDLLEQLRAELRTHLLPYDKEITRKDIQQLPFLRCCLNESKFDLQDRNLGDKKTCMK